jgi:hypothetical protein
MTLDDTPIPVNKPKTFQELLDMEMAKGSDGGIISKKANKPPPME